MMIRRSVDGGLTVMTRHVEVDDALWDEFHRVVNMSSRELLEWLRVRSADEQTEELPDQAGTQTGQRVLQILKKRRVDLTEDDERILRKVVDKVHAERRADLEPTAGQENWRRRLMTIGHDLEGSPALTPTQHRRLSDTSRKREFMMGRESAKHSPREDEQLKRELRGTLQGNRSSRAEEWRDPESPADDDPDVTNAGPPIR